MLDIFNYVDNTEYETPLFHKNYSNSDEARAKTSETLTGRKQSAETVAKRAASNTGKKRDASFGAKLRKQFKNKNNHNVTWKTPYGVFTSSKLAAQAEPEIIDASTIRFRCTSKTFSDYVKINSAPKANSYLYHTPMGVFKSSQEAADANSINVGSTIRKYCNDKNNSDYFREIVK